MADHLHDSGCSCALQSTASQSIQELEFDRGIWSDAMNGAVDKVKRLLSKGVDPSKKDPAGYTALHYASRHGHIEVCQVLLSAGASVNSQTPGGATPLHRAAYCGHESVVKELIDGGADLRLVDSDGQTALHKAAEKGWLTVTELLIDSCPENIRLQDHRGRFPVDLVKQGRTSETLQKMLMIEHLPNNSD